VKYCHKNLYILYSCYW